MGQINQREVIMLASQVITTSGAGPDIVVPQGWQAAILAINSNTVTGTSPTWNFFLQAKIGQAAATDLVSQGPTGTAIYDDTLAFTQLTTNGNQIARIVTSGPAAGTPGTSGSLAVAQDYLQKDAALTAGNYRIGPMGGLWRMKWTVTGTSPSGTFAVVAQLIPFST